MSLDSVREKKRDIVQVLAQKINYHVRAQTQNRKNWIQIRTRCVCDRFVNKYLKIVAVDTVRERQPQQPLQMMMPYEG